MAIGHMDRESSTDIKVLVVGAGLGGLYAAIECHRQGHSVTVLESKPGLEAIGDFVGIGQSVTKQFEKWPGMAKRYRSIIYRPEMVLLTHDGQYIGGPFPLSENSHHRPVPVLRPKLIDALYDCAVSLGIPIFFRKRVIAYGESTESDHGYATTDYGERFEADVVIAADGIGTKVNKIMSGKEVKAVSSGFSVYRVSYPTAILQEDAFLAEQYSFKPNQPDYCEVYIGPQGNMIILISRKHTTWLFTHKDDGQAEETWSTRLNASIVLESLQKTGLTWDKRCLSIIARTPPNSIVDYKITWRDPDPIWTSPGGRVVKIGDAAHAFIPNSTAGATQAMEDGQCLAACLRLAGKTDVSLATRVHTKLRFERTSCAQKSGFRNREKWDTANFEKVKNSPQEAARSIGRWLSHHDPEQYVYDNWEACVNHIVHGEPFKNTNLPSGYDYEPWTMDQLLKSTKDGVMPEDPGDWN